MAEYEEKMLLQALENAGWVKTRAAELLKIKRTTLIEKMKRLGIPLKRNGLRRVGDDEEGADLVGGLPTEPAGKAQTA
jgi:hypothetical protein